ncbi:GAF domain-containing protein [Ramlibacter sp. AN1133]|uniref:GAF domain-containing protein n=1 Tax=Ramlibacter sp. AN1133 TaxID=3133429 RepID=UPI0030C50D05
MDLESAARASAHGQAVDPDVLLEASERLCDALHRCDDPAAALAHIDAARLALLGPGLLTVNVDATKPQDPPGEIHLLRAWTSDPLAYPVGGRKRKLRTPWTEQLLVRGEVFIGEGEASLAAAFDDAALIASLGLRGVINVPLMNGGRPRATFNVLGTRAQWQPHEIAAVRLLALVARHFILRLASTLEVADFAGSVRDR